MESVKLEEQLTTSCFFKKISIVQAILKSGPTLLHSVTKQTLETCALINTLKKLWPIPETSLTVDCSVRRMCSD